MVLPFCAEFALVVGFGESDLFPNLNDVTGGMRTDAPDGGGSLFNVRAFAVGVGKGVGQSVERMRLAIGCKKQAVGCVQSAVGVRVIAGKRSSKAAVLRLNLRLGGGNRLGRRGRRQEQQTRCKDTPAQGRAWFAGRQE